MAALLSPGVSILKPSKSILKNPANSTLGYKRKEMDLDPPSPSDSGAASASSKKRARVTFETDAHQQPVHDGGGLEKSAAVVREEVHRAIQRHRMGDSDAYDRVKEVFVSDPKELED